MTLMEFHQHAVARRLDDAAPAFRDRWVDQILAHGRRCASVSVSSASMSRL
jgi:hypothetical protein